MTTASFSKLLTQTASTKRPPAVSVSGLRGAAVTNLASLSCTPLTPVSGELAVRAGVKSPTETKQTMCDGGLDIREGDFLVVSGVDYAIRAVEEWPHHFGGGSSTYLVLYVEQEKAA